MLLAGCKQNTNMSTLNLTQEWDKTFPKSDLVEHSKVIGASLLTKRDIRELLNVPEPLTQNQNVNELKLDF